MLQVALVVVGFLAVAVTRRHRRRRLPAQAVIVSPRQSTSIARDGAVRSVQSAELTISQDDLERLWAPENLENLARTYWRFLSRVTLGLIRVVYGHDERAVVFLARPFTLLRFGAPEYEISSDRGLVRWRIRDGLLVARDGCGCGFLAIEVRRVTPPGGSDGLAKLYIEVEVANFYPAIARGFSTPVYEATQSSIHVLVTHAFLRSLANLDLARSKVGRLAAAVEAAPEPSAVTDAGEGAELAAVVSPEDAPNGSGPRPHDQ
jgi:hypothetical protein